MSEQIESDVIVFFTENSIDRSTMLGQALFRNGKLAHMSYEGDDIKYGVIGFGPLLGEGVVCRQGDSLEQFLWVCDNMFNIVYKIEAAVKHSEKPVKSTRVST